MAGKKRVFDSSKERRFETAVSFGRRLKTAAPWSDAAARRPYLSKRTRSTCE
jgi:hypothetical protein